MHAPKGLQQHTVVMVLIFLDWLWLKCTASPARVLCLLPSQPGERAPQPSGAQGLLPRLLEGACRAAHSHGSCKGSPSNKARRLYSIKKSKNSNGAKKYQNMF